MRHLSDLLVRIPYHRAEFVEIKDAISPAGPLRHIKDRPPRLHGNGHGDKQEKRAQHQQSQTGDNDVEYPLRTKPKCKGMILRVTLFDLRLQRTMRTLLELPEEPDLAPQTRL